MIHFHNTIGESGDALIASNDTCKTQEEKILAIFKEKGSSWNLDPFDVLEIFKKLYADVPITSIRRAMSNLTKENKLIKTNFMKLGAYGKQNFTWKYNDSFGK